MNYTKNSIEDIKVWLKKYLTEEKYAHSLGVMNYAVELAERFSLDIEKARIAGLLHDCAKNFSKSKTEKLVSDNNIELNEEEKQNYKTLHAPVSAFVAEHEFGVVDKEILSAIRYHTIGRVDMTDFEKIIYIADKAEPVTRETKIIEAVEEALKNEDALDKAVIALLSRTIKHLLKKQKQICSTTINVYNQLIKCSD